jgi:diaminopimelate decarboxylase
MRKNLPFSHDQIIHLARQFPTPFYLYDEEGIRANARELKRAFAWAHDFREFFAVKATPNPYIMKVLREEGFGADASSLPELILAEKVGLRGSEIMFSSNNTPAHEYVKARSLGATINLDDITHIEFLKAHAGLPELICCRYNPGELRSGNAIIGNPIEAKYGFTRAQIFEGFKLLRNGGVRRFGIHTMVVSNELRLDSLVQNARVLFELAVEIHKRLGITVEFVNVGGGIGVPYKPDQQPIVLEDYGEGVRQAYDDTIVPAGLHPVGVYMENGRSITGPYGYLVTRAIHEKHIYRDYIGVDACMANLMRPGMYGAYHHISVLGKEDQEQDHVYDVVGSLCENNDKFAIQRNLPAIDVGDYLVIHDSGAHGHSMGFQYNGKLRCAELLLHGDGSVTQIRRAETLDDYFATIDFSKIGNQRALSSEPSARLAARKTQ